MRRGLLVVAGVLLLAAPAAGAGGLTSPGDGTVVTGAGVVPVRAVLEGGIRPAELLLQPPGAAEPVPVDRQAAPDDTELAYDLDPACAPPVCTVAPNGEWRVVLTGDTQDERRFVLRLPPAVPSSVTAVPRGDGTELSWARGAEPDLRGYSVDDASGAAVLPSVGLDACDPTTCRVAVPDADGWTVRASRSVCPDCREVVTSRASSLVRPAAADPAADAAPAAPPRVRPQAVPAPPARGGFTVPGRPGVAVPELGPQAEEPVETRLEYGSGPVAEPAQAAGDVLSGERYRVLAAGVVLIAAATWLRRWSRRTGGED